MGPPVPVTVGTFLFIGTFAVIVLWAFAFSRGGYISKDSFQIISVVTITLGISTWLLWLCAWMHQWHPLVYPTWKAAE